jgi:hypothetical protein
VGSKNGVDRKMDKNQSRTDLLAAGKKKVSLFVNLSILISYVQVFVCVCFRVISFANVVK